MLQQTVTKKNGATQRRRRAAAVFARDGRRCRLCGSTYQLTTHCIRPPVLGGRITYENLTTLCWRCHNDTNYFTFKLGALLIWRYVTVRLWIAHWTTHRDD
jgi:5-methylcytosine-specific restriction endonuclease McrA